jgi:hypothetical protein
MEEIPEKREIEHGEYIACPYEGKIKSKETGRYIGSTYASTGYAYVSKGMSRIAVHRIIYQAFHNVTLTPEQQINHINHQKDDNRITNLEVVTNQQNTQWQRVRVGTYKGVFWNEEKQKWKADLKYKDKNNFLGYFDNEIDAAKAYNSYGAFLNRTEDCRYLLNEIPEENYTVTPLNIPEQNKQTIAENTSCPSYTGVSFVKSRNNYAAGIKHKGKSYNLGSFKEAVEAAKIYNSQALYFNNHENGKFVLNTIPGFTTIEKHIIGEKALKKAENKKSVYVGVTFSNQSRKWKAILVYDKKQQCIGSFSTEIEAAKAYNARVIELNNQIRDNNEKRPTYKLNNIVELLR